MSSVVRDIVIIDEDKCDGCGACVPSCAEGALRIVDGKARLVSEVYCDGLGACLGHCPRGAIRVEKRQAQAFDEEAARAHVTSTSGEVGCPAMGTAAQCPSVAARGPVLSTPDTGARSPETTGLPNWPIQLGLVSPSAPFLRDADLLLAADCTGYAYGGFRRLGGGRPVLVACPKLDDAEAHIAKLAAILSTSSVKSITILRMEVPCCSGLVRIAAEAVARSGKNIPVDVIVVSMDGELMKA